MKLTCARPAVEKLWTMRWLLCLLATREPLLQLPNATAQAGLVKTENKYELYERVGIQEMRGESTLGFIFLQEVVQLSSVLLSCRSPLALRRFLTRYPTCQGPGHTSVLKSDGYCAIVRGAYSRR